VQSICDVSRPAVWEGEVGKEGSETGKIYDVKSNRKISI